MGGFSSLRPAPGAPRYVEGDVPEEFRAEAMEGEATRVLLAQLGVHEVWGRPPCDLGVGVPVACWGNPTHVDGAALGPEAGGNRGGDDAAGT